MTARRTHQLSSLAMAIALVLACAPTPASAQPQPPGRSPVVPARAIIADRSRLEHLATSYQPSLPTIEQTSQPETLELAAPTPDESGGEFFSPELIEAPTPESVSTFESQSEGSERTTWGTERRARSAARSAANAWCAPTAGFYTSFEALLWWEKGTYLPALATTSPVGTPASVAGVLGEPSTTVLFGEQIVNRGFNRPGGRLTLGYWFDDSECNGLEGSYLFLGRNQTNRVFSSPEGAVILAQPFYDVVGEEQAASLLSYPGVIGGTLTIDLKSEVQSATATYFHRIRDAGFQHLDLLAGYRYFVATDRLAIGSASTVVDDPLGIIPVGTKFSVVDLFQSLNEFQGAELGLRFVRQSQRWTLNVQGRAAVGVVHQVVQIAGSDTVVVPGGPTLSQPTGGYVQPSNSGTFSRNHLAVVPELRTEIGFYLTPRLQFTVGYTLLALSNAVRAGEQIDPALNLTQVPGPTIGEVRPVFNFREDVLWVQGVNLGLTFEF